MIREITIQNFQSHQYTNIALSPNITVVTGRPQAGKSAIYKALWLLCKNRPSGFRYNSYTKYPQFFSDDPTFIEIVTDEHKISFTKTKGSALYRLDDQEWTGVGTKIPDNVAHALNVGDINFQKQMSLPFLMLSTPSQVAKEVNRLTGLEFPEGVVSDLDSEIGLLKKQIRQHDADIVLYEESMRKYDDLDRLQEIFDLVTEAEGEISSISGTIAELNLLFTEHLDAIEELEPIEKALLAGGDLDRVRADLSTVSSIDLSIDLLHYFVETSIEIDQTEEYLSFIVQIMGELEMKLGRIDLVETDIGILEPYIDHMTDLVDIESAMDLLKENYQNILEELGKCPTCFADIDDSVIKRITDGL